MSSIPEPTALAGKNPITALAVSHFSLIRVSSISCASSYSLRAASPVAGLLRMSGKRPFISQALKNGCQSMYSRNSARSYSLNSRTPRPWAGTGGV